MMTIDFTSIAALLAGICVVFFVVQMSVMCGFYSRIHRHFRKDAGTDPVEYPPLSVIVVTKDTGELLHDSLTAILEQDYPAFEVIVVNDLSAGEDELILKRLANIYPNLYHTFIPETARYVSRKKLGVAMGIRASHYEWVVVTSPYARPESKEWLRSLAREMTPETDIVLGYSNYVYGKGMFALRVRTDAFSVRCVTSAWHLPGILIWDLGIIWHIASVPIWNTRASAVICSCSVVKTICW